MQNPILRRVSNLIHRQIQVGASIPKKVEFHYDFPPQHINLSERFAGKSVVLVGLPGAFTPTWSATQVPGYIKAQDAFKELGVDEVIIYCVNDAAVMKGWSKDQNVPTENDGIITMMADPFGNVTKSLGMEMTHSGPASVGIFGRCKRFALFLKDGVVKIVRVSEGPDDPAGDSDPSATLSDAMIEAIKDLEKPTEVEKTKETEDTAEEAKGEETPEAEVLTSGETAEDDTKKE